MNKWIIKYYTKAEPVCLLVYNSLRRYWIIESVHLCTCGVCISSYCIWFFAWCLFVVLFSILYDECFVGWNQKNKIVFFCIVRSSGLIINCISCRGFEIFEFLAPMYYGTCDLMNFSVWQTNWQTQKRIDPLLHVVTINTVLCSICAGSKSVCGYMPTRQHFLL